MAVTENFLKTNSCRAIPLILLPCLHCLLSCRYDVYQDASIKEPSSFPPHESITELYKDFYNRSINSRSIREYWYPLVEVLTVVVEVVVNSISTDSISKSLIWTTEERNRINERELGKARIPHSDASPLSHITDSMYLCLTLVTRRKTTSSISLTGSKRTIFVIPFTNMTLSYMSFVVGLAQRRVSVAQWWNVTRKPHFSWVTRMKK